MTVPPIHLFIPLLLPAASGDIVYQMETAEAQRVEAVLTSRIRVPGIAAQEWLLFAAKAPDLPGQSHVTTTVEPRAAEAFDFRLHRPLERAIVTSRGRDLASEITVHVTYRATLLSRRLVPLPRGTPDASGAKLGRDQRQAALGPSTTCDFQSKAFQQWLDHHDLRCRGDEDTIDFARRVFVTIQDNFTYQFPAGHDGKASSAIAAGAGDCGSLCAVFVSALRANGVPARALLGHWARSMEPRGASLRSTQCHVKAEFIADGVGWVPVDPSRSLNDRSPGGLRFFGYDPGDFLTQHVDFDLVLPAGRFGRRPVPQLQGTAYWVSGPGSVKGATVTEDWQVRTLRP
jgi:hypothetical protein